MPSVEFESRRNALITQGVETTSVAVQARPKIARPKAEGPKRPRPTADEDRSHTDRLGLALARLARGGITGNRAYSPVFRMLAKTGIVAKPLHFWSFLPLVGFGFLMVAVIMALTVALCLALGTLPRPVAVLIESGPAPFIAMAASLGLIFAAVHRIEAAKLDLPRWQDL